MEPSVEQWAVIARECMEKVTSSDQTMDTMQREMDTLRRKLATLEETHGAQVELLVLSLASVLQEQDARA